MKKQFHKSENGLSNEDWYYLTIDTDKGSVTILHEWSHSDGGPFNFKSSEKSYTIEEFQKHKPHQHRIFVQWLKDKLGDA